MHLWLTQIKKPSFFPEFDLGIMSDLCSIWVRHRPSVRGRARGAAGEARRRAGAGARAWVRGGVGLRRRESAAEWVRGGLDNFEGSPYMLILTDGDAEWLYRPPLASPTKYQKFSRKSLFTASRVFYLGGAVAPPLG